MSIQSLMTPAMFIVSADVLPISRNTACMTAQHMCVGQPLHRVVAAADVLRSAALCAV